MWRQEQKEYALGRPGFKDMYWEGEYPDITDCSTEVDKKFF